MKKVARGEDQRFSNDHTRLIFRQAVADLFGGEDRIPLAVKTAMRLKDYDHGKPLTARRIDAVRQAVERHFAAYPAAFEQAKTLAARVCSQFDAAAVNAAIAQALSPVITDPDATQIVVRYIDRILVTDNQQLRPVEEIRRHVQDLLVNVQELRSAGKDNRLAFDVGFALLDRLCGRTLPNGLFTLLFAGMNTYSLQGLQKRQARMRSRADPSVAQPIRESPPNHSAPVRTPGGGERVGGPNGVSGVRREDDAVAAQPPGTPEPA